MTQLRRGSIGALTNDINKGYQWLDHCPGIVSYRFFVPNVIRALPLFPHQGGGTFPQGGNALRHLIFMPLGSANGPFIRHIHLLVSAR